MTPFHSVLKRLPQALAQPLAQTVLLSLALTALSSAQAAVFTGRNATSIGGLGVTTANTMAINPDGIGHLLLMPYYSAQSGNATIVSITNMDAQNGKAVKVRFRAATNADTVFDLTVFLAPNDVWNAVVTQNAASGLAQLSTADGSCTLPTMGRDVSYPFYTARLDATLSATEQANQTREGYVEVLNMADIQPITTAGSLFQSISHVNGKPFNCAAPSVLATLVDAPTEFAAAAMGFAAPTTGLEGNWTLINVPKTLTFSGNATAVQAMDNIGGKSARANYVLFPQSNGVVTGVDALTADPLLRSNPSGTKTAVGVTTPYAPAVGGLPVVTALQYDFPDLSTPYLSYLTLPHLQAVALSTALAAKTVANDFTIELNVLAATDWVFTLPTKRYSVGTDYRQTPPARVYNLGAGRGGVEFFSDNAATPVDAVPALYFDRDGARQSVAGKPTAVVLKGATSVLSFGAAASALGARVANDNARGVTFNNGWGTLDMTNAGAGLPVLGVGLIRATNPAAAPGVSGNYGITTEHRYTR